jgi:hypothetical protein
VDRSVTLKTGVLAWGQKGTETTELDKEREEVAWVRKEERVQLILQRKTTRNSLQGGGKVLLNRTCQERKCHCMMDISARVDNRHHCLSRVIS